ncbi:MAG: hypothetical protein JKY92_05385 [Magnetovibrio sp.]|nr:hypothetical protein [Magnetovibrio sp.]
MTNQWTQEPERGSLFLIRFVTWLAKTLGRSITRILLHPITLYFLIFHGRARRHSAAYLSQVHAKPARLVDVYTHIWWFSATILDRVFFLTDCFDEFDIQIHNLDVLTKHLDQKQGCIMLGAHLGSFEAMRCMASRQDNLSLKILMYPENSQRINSVINALNPKLAESIIPLGHPQSMIAVKEWLDKGGSIGILGDRISIGEKVVPVQFLNAEAEIPQGPMILASVTGVPVIMFTALYRGGRRYDILFHELSDGLRPARAERQAIIAHTLQDYADQLEVWCRMEPNNWFNFYNFWKKAESYEE